jgi:hypothetical protein
VVFQTIPVSIVLDRDTKIRYDLLLNGATEININDMIPSNLGGLLWFREPYGFTGIN